MNGECHEGIARASFATVASDECDEVDEPWLGEYWFRPGNLERRPDGDPTDER